MTFVLLVSSSACSNADRIKTYPERYEQFVSLLGESRETVLNQLNLSENDLVPAQKGLYSIPVSARYNGLTFSVTLEFDEINQRLLGFSYTKQWEDAWDDAVRDVGLLAKALTKTYGEARDDIDPVRFSSMTESELKEAFDSTSSQNTQVGTDYWLIEKRTSSVLSEYIALIRKQNPTRKILDEAMLSLNMQVFASKSIDRAMAELRFRLDVME